MAEFKTHTGLLLEWKDEKVTLTGDAGVKVLHPLGNEKYNMGLAKQTFELAKKHYEARAEAEK